MADNDNGQPQFRKMHVQVIDKLPEIGAVAFAVYGVLLKYANFETGVCWPSIRTIAAESGLAPNSVTKALRKLKGDGLIQVQRRASGKGVLPRNVYTLPLVAVAPGATTPPDSVAPGATTRRTTCDSTVALRATEQEEGKQESRNQTSPGLRPEEENRGLAEWMFSLISEMQPNRKPPNLAAWANEIRLMRTIDGRTPEQIRVVFEWANKDTFWRTVILSPSTLRRKYDDLDLKRTTAGNGHRNGSGRPGRSHTRGSDYYGKRPVLSNR